MSWMQLPVPMGSAMVPYSQALLAALLGATLAATVRASDDGGPPDDIAKEASSHEKDNVLCVGRLPEDAADSGVLQDVALLRRFRIHTARLHREQEDCEADRKPSDGPHRRHLPSRDTACATGIVAHAQFRRKGDGGRDFRASPRVERRGRYLPVTGATGR